MHTKPTQQWTYKRIGDTALQAHVFEPVDAPARADRAGAIFFFGGGWRGGTPEQFFPQCAYLASRGVVAISAEYRVLDRHGVTPYECVRDGKSAVRWFRSRAEDLGVDPGRIAAGGGSAGGHVAACTGTVVGLEGPGEDEAISSRPDAMLLFNPALLLDWRRFGLDAAGLNDLKARFEGRDPAVICPFRNLKPGVPPSIIFHGTDDRVVPVETVREYTKEALRLGLRCELRTYEGEGHGFFNFGRSARFFDTLRELDGFLVSLGFLEGRDSVDVFRRLVE